MRIRVRVHSVLQIHVWARAEFHTLGMAPFTIDIVWRAERDGFRHFTQVEYMYG